MAGMENQTQILLDEIERFIADRGMSATAFGAKSLGDPKLVFELRQGRELRFSTIEKIGEFMTEKAV